MTITLPGYFGAACCAVLNILFLLPFAILGERRRRRGVQEIRAAMASGYFDEHKNTKIRRMRWLGLVALLGLLGMFSFLVIMSSFLFTYYRTGVLPHPSPAVSIAFFASGVLSLVCMPAGILMDRLSRGKL